MNYTEGREFVSAKSRSSMPVLASSNIPSHTGRRRRVSEAQSSCDHSKRPQIDPDLLSAVETPSLHKVADEKSNTVRDSKLDAWLSVPVGFQPPLWQARLLIESLLGAASRHASNQHMGLSGSGVIIQYLQACCMCMNQT